MIMTPPIVSEKTSYPPSSEEISFSPHTQSISNKFFAPPPSGKKPKKFSTEALTTLKWSKYTISILIF